MLEEMSIEELEAMIASYPKCEGDLSDEQISRLVAELPDHDLELAARHGILTPLAAKVLGYDA